MNEGKKGYKEKKQTVAPSRPRNFVAKNAIGSGAGAHKDKKKAAKQGEVKHKTAELAEDITEGILKEDIMGAPPPESNHEASMALSELYRNAKYGMALLKIIESNDAIDGWVQGNLTSAASMLDKVYHYLDYKNINGRKPEVEDIEEDDDNIDDAEQGESDGSMARKNLEMIVEYSIKLMEIIKPGDNLASWVSMKLTKASEAVSSSKHFIEYRQFEKHASDAFENKLVRRLSKQLSEMTGKHDAAQRDYDSSVAGMDGSDKRDFKSREMHHELDHEDRGMYAVVIAKNGKWEYTKAQPSQEGMNAAQNIINSLHSKYPNMHLGMKGPDGKVYNFGKGK
jgi:hypothetical protein